MTVVDRPDNDGQDDEKRDRYGHTPADHRANGCLRPSMDARVAASATEYPRGSDLSVAFERGWDAHRLAAQPSAGTGTLRERVEALVTAAKTRHGAWSEHSQQRFTPTVPVHELRAALDAR